MMKDDSPPSSPTMMFDENESTDDELPSLGKRLQLNKDINYSETSPVFSTSSSPLFCSSTDDSSVTENWNKSLIPNHIANGLVGEASSSHHMGNKKRQFGDKNSEQIGKPKRTCLSESHAVDKFCLTSTHDERTRNITVEELRRHISDSVQKFSRDKSKNSQGDTKNHTCYDSLSSSSSLCDLEQHNETSSNEKTFEINHQDGKLSNKLNCKVLNGKNKNAVTSNYVDSNACGVQHSLQTSDNMKDMLNLPSTSRSGQQNLGSFPLKPTRFTPIPLGVHFIDSDSDGDINTASCVPSKGSLKGGGSILCSDNKIKQSSFTRKLNIIYDDSDDDRWSSVTIQEAALLPTDNTSSMGTLKSKESNKHKDIAKCKNKSSNVASEIPLGRFRNPCNLSSDILQIRKTNMEEEKMPHVGTSFEKLAKSTRHKSKHCQNRTSDGLLPRNNHDSEDECKSSVQEADPSSNDSVSSVEASKTKDVCSRRDMTKCKNKSSIVINDRPFDRFRNSSSSSSSSSSLAEISQMKKTRNSEDHNIPNVSFRNSSRSTRLQTKRRQNNAQPLNTLSETNHNSFAAANKNSDEGQASYQPPVTTQNESQPTSKTQRCQNRISRSLMAHRQTTNPRHHGNRNATMLQNLANVYPDLFDAEESSDETEFFTANSYSDSETGAESLILEDHTLLSGFPETRGNSVVTLHVGSSDDEVSVIFSSNSTSLDEESQSSQRRHRHQRGHVRRGRGRSSCRNRSHMGQDVANSSPDPVEQVRQMEEDERLARMLQAQFDAEVNDEDTSDSYSVMDSSDNQESLIDVMDQFFGVLSPEEVTSPRQRGRQQGRRASSSQSPWQYAPENRGGARGRTRVLQGGQGRPLIVPHGRGRQTRRRSYVNPWMWQFARMLGLNQTHAHSNTADHSGNDYEELLQIAENLGEAVPRGLCKAEINMLPTRIYRAPSSMTFTSDEAIRDSSEENKECQVCLSDYETGNILRILPCFHEFHTICIDPWLKINHTCPVCRVEVNLDQ